MKRISLLSVISVIYLAVFAQSSKLYLDDSWMYTELKIQQNDINNTCKALIDTGCSFCTVDSSYLVNNFNVVAESLERTNVIDAKKNCFSVKINSISFCGKNFKDVFCIVLDLKSIFRQYAPDFIIGANVLHKHSWKFNIKDSILSICDKNKGKGIILKWKSHDDYKDINLGYVVFEGKVGGKNNRFVFDTGSKECKLQKDLYSGEKEIITKESADIYQSFAIIKKELFKDVCFDIANYSFSANFINGHAHGNFGFLNISFLKGKSFILNYPKKTFTIIN